MERSQEIYCECCGKYLFTEIETSIGVKRIGDRKKRKHYHFHPNECCWVCNNCEEIFNESFKIK